MKVKLTNEYGEQLDVTYSYDNVHVNDSYLVKSNRIADWINRIIKCGVGHGYEYSRSAASWVNEWKAHNFLYDHGVKPNRTKDVDLNEDETALRKLCYCLLSKFYI